MDPKIYRELRSEMMMTVDMLIKAIQINKKINKE
jgi:hypothetical protein